MGISTSSDRGKVWKTSEFELKSRLCGETRFPYSSWGDFVTYTDANGNGDGHIWIHALAKNYLEIAMSNLFRQGMGLDHVCFAQDSDWSHNGFFMRYQEISLSPQFYSGLACPRRTTEDLPAQFLTINTRLCSVGSTSLLAEQKLIVEGVEVGSSLQQLCCIDRRSRTTSKLPESFTSHPAMQPLTKVTKPRFPVNFTDSNSRLLGTCQREVFVTDTDENNHLNEGGYLRFITDAFYKVAKDSPKSIRFKRVRALYKREVLSGDICTISVFKNHEQNNFSASFHVGETEVFHIGFELL